MVGKGWALGALGGEDRGDHKEVASEEETPRPLRLWAE